MAKKKSSVNAVYTKRMYGKTRSDVIDYNEAYALVSAAHPESDVKGMLSVPNNIRCAKCVVGVEIENAVLIKGEFEAEPEEKGEPED